MTEKKGEMRRLRGRDLDLFARSWGIRREPARLLGLPLPWRQLDSTLRARITALVSDIPPRRR